MLTLTQLLVIAVIAIPLLLVSLNRTRADVAALGIAVALGVLQYAGVGVVGAPGDRTAAVKAVAGFSQPVVLTLIGLFMTTYMLEKTGVTRWLAGKILALSGTSEQRVVALFTVCAAALGLVMNKVTVGVLLLPSAMNAARRTGIKPSKLLIPMVFGTLLGGMATYLTTANIIVDGLLRAHQPPQAPLNFLDFTPTGGIIMVLGVAFIAVFGARLLPNRQPMAEQMLALPTGSDLEDVYALGDRLWAARVQPGSSLVNSTLEEAGIGQRLGLSVIAIERGRQTIFAPGAIQTIESNDVLMIVGREDRVMQLQVDWLQIEREEHDAPLSARGGTFVELLVAPHSRALGQTLKQLEFRQQYGFTAVAIWRDGKSVRTDVGDFVLREGDAFLLTGDRMNLKKLRRTDQFIVLATDDSDQPLQPKRAAATLLITAVTIGMAVLGFPVYLAALLGALAVVLSKLLPMEEAYRAVEWQVIFVVAGMYAVSSALVQTGLAALMGDMMVAVVAPFGALGLAAGCFTLSVVLTHIMGGQVTALVTGPVAISAALALNTNPQAMAVASAIGCSAAFLSPLAHSVNLLVVSPGNYQPTDFLRLGVPLMLIVFVGLMLGMALFWGL
ncbi:MAG: SLC13 family permease [Armatimonadetes bacterium]|nr:SLC13 family permease [Anaerolineae bacterium]